MSVATLNRAVVTDLKRHADPAHAEKDKRYHKYDGYKSYGIRAPELDRLLKAFKADILELSCSEAMRLAEALYRSRIEEQLHAGAYALALKADCLELPKRAAYLDRLANSFMSWSTVDNFCARVLQPLLMKYPEPAIKLLRKWNGSRNIRNMWKQRASAVAFTRKVGESGQFSAAGLELCDNLAGSSEDLIQKAVGWALKDLMRGDKRKVLAHVKKLRRQGAPATITLYAIRDLKGLERDAVLKIKRK